MLGDIFHAIAFGIVVYLSTAAFLGREKAKYLPGGAIGAYAIVHMWYIGVIFGLVGHIIGVAFLALISKK